MQFAKRFPFEVTFKVAKLQGESVSDNLSPGAAAECRLKLRPSAVGGGGCFCEVRLLCRCADAAAFAYAEVRLTGRGGRDQEQPWAGDLPQRFDSATPERLLGLRPLPTIGGNARFLAANLRLSGELLLEEGCGPDAFAPDGLCDVRVVVEGRELHLHRALLAKVSPVFRAMLLGGFREAAPDAPAVELPGKGLGQFLELLSTVYPPQLELHCGRAKTLLPLLAEYQMDHLMRRCECALLRSPLYDAHGGGDPCDMKLPQSWLEEALEHAHLAAVFQLPELLDRSVELLAGVQAGGCQEALKGLLPDDILCRIFARRVSLLEGKVCRMGEELEGCRNKLQVLAATETNA